MIVKDIEITCNGRVLATKVYSPESVREQSKGAYGLDLNNGTAMMFIFDDEKFQVFDMMWMKNDIGYLSLDKNHKINKVGVMKGAFLGIFGKPYPMNKCQVFIELNPKNVEGLKVGDEVTWRVIGDDTHGK